MLQEFFGDANVRFPQYPIIVPGIRTYISPNGLGIQFRGSSEKIAITGKRAITLWEWLTPFLDGKHSLDEILLHAQEDPIVSIGEIGEILKTLHCYHMVYDSEIASKPKLQRERVLSGVLKQQQDFLSRVFPFMGANSNISEVNLKLRDASVMFIVNKELLEILVMNVVFSGIANVGIFVLSSESETLSFPEDRVILLKGQKVGYIGSPDRNGLRSLLNQEILNYKYIVPFINNPNPFFIAEIARSCSRFNRRMLPIALFENVYEIGPFFIPGGESSCCACRHLRKQSFGDNALYDFLYNQHLEEAQLVFDEQILGYNFRATNIALNIALDQIIMCITQVSQPSLINNVLTYDALKLTISSEHVIKVPGCPYCS